MSELRTNRSRAGVLGPMVSMTCLVKLGSNLDAAGLGLGLVAIVAGARGWIYGLDSSGGMMG